MTENQCDPMHVDRLLSRYVSSSRELRGMLISRDSIIVGSTVTQMVLHETYEDSDLDIMMHESCRDAWVGYLASEGYARAYEVDETNIHYPGCIDMRASTFNVTRYTWNVPVFKVTKYMRDVDSVCVDLITCCEGATMPLHHYVLDYDLSCCQGTFNGVDVLMYHYELTVAKIAVVEQIESLPPASDRCEKYVGRGFRLIRVTSDIERLSDGQRRVWSACYRDTMSSVVPMPVSNDFNVRTGLNLDIYWKRLRHKVVHDIKAVVIHVSIHRAYYDELLELASLPPTMGLSGQTLYRRGGYLYREAMESCVAKGMLH